MTIITRRNFLAGAGTCSLSPVIPFTRWSGSHTEMGEAIVANEYELLHGCIFARMDGKRSSSGDAFTAPSIDFWTFRVSEIESSTLPASVARVIIWEDVFLPRTLARGVRSILEVVPEWYGLDPLLGRCSFHIDGFSEIGPVAKAVLPATTGPIRYHRLALIDVESCGVSRIDWPDVLPHLRNSYDLIIGFAHFVGRGPSHRLELCDGPLDNSRIANTLACCDLSFWTSDYLLGFDEVLDWKTRAPLLVAVIHDLVHALSTTDLTRTLAGTTEAQRLFASRLRPEGLNETLAMSLGYDEKGALLVDGRIAL